MIESKSRRDALHLAQGKPALHKERMTVAFVRAASKKDLPVGKICEVQVNGASVALANVAGKFCAISGICMHEAGPLGEGELEGQVVTCPWHGWQYDMTTGKVVQNPTIGVESYPVEVRGEDVFVDVGQ
jgi:nitrite reductase/ring-hydroxylating ferredoxin subunit